MRMWKKKVYIASWLGSKIDENGYEVNEYDKPQLYYMNVQPISGYSDIMEYGERVAKTQKAIVDASFFKGKIKEGDMAYLDGETPEGEKINGYNANYVVDSVRIQNLKIAIYFNKLQK